MLRRARSFEYFKDLPLEEGQFPGHIPTPSLHMLMVSLYFSH